MFWGIQDDPGAGPLGNAGTLMLEASWGYHPEILRLMSFFRECVFSQKNTTPVVKKIDFARECVCVCLCVVVSLTPFLAMAMMGRDQDRTGTRDRGHGPGPLTMDQGLAFGVPVGLWDPLPFLDLVVLLGHWNLCALGPLF